MEKTSPKDPRGNGLGYVKRDIITQLHEIVADITSGASDSVSRDTKVTQDASLGNSHIACQVFATWKVLEY